MDIKKNAAQQIREYLQSQNLSQVKLIERLEKEHGFKIDKTRMSRLLQGEVSTEVCRTVCMHLGLPDPSLPKQTLLRVGFASGFWSAPILSKLDETNKTTTHELLKKVTLTAYEMADTKKEVFNKIGKTPEPYNRDEHNFYFSGEILYKLKHKKIDVGFMGSTLAKEHEGDLLRVAKVCDAASARHAILVAAPSGVFTGETYLQREKQVIRYLVNAPQAKEEEAFRTKPKCLFLYQDDSTSQLEYELLFRPAMHRGEAIQILNTKSFMNTFREKLIANRDKIVVQIALMLTVDAAESVAQALNNEGFELEIFKFRTSVFFDVPKLKEKVGWAARDFSLDMVVLNKRANEIIQHPGFFPLVEYLNDSTKKLTDEKRRTEGSTPRVFQNVLDFYQLSESAVGHMREIDYHLLYYHKFMDLMRDLRK